MKKIILFALILLAAASQQTSAQGADPAQMAQRFKERVKPMLLEKVKLSETEAEKVLDVQLENRQHMRTLRDLSEDERKKKVKELQASMETKYKDIPLSSEQIRKVNEFFEEQRQAMNNQRERRGGNQ